MRFQPAMPELPSTYLEDETVPRAVIEHAPDPVRICRIVLTAAAEVLAGRRHVDQMARWTSPELFDALARRAGLARRILGETPGPACSVHSVHAQLTLTGACEATALLMEGTRARAAALRLEIQRGRWVLAALEIS